MRHFMVLAIALATATVALADAPSVYEAAGEPPVASRIDQIVFARLKAEGVRPARLCSDAVFLRRAHLDLIGRLPTADEARAFLDDKAADKRARLVDALLQREEFADYWAMRWGDVLRIKSEFPINLWPNAVQAYHHWIRTAVAENMPYDAFARELLTASGSNFRVPQVNFYRATQENTPEALAKTVALTFMGDRTDSWPQERRQGMAAFFRRIGYKRTAEWKEEIVLFDLTTEVTRKALLPDGTTAEMASDQDPRQVFADWLITEQNPWFNRAIVNRMWAWLLGRGIVEEVDDIRPDNPPSHPELLAHLQDELVRSRYDLRHLIRLITASSTYQLASVPRGDEAPPPELFACYPLRRLDAEVLIDALCQVTGTTEEYSSQIPEPFTWVPKEMRTVALPDGSITSSFLDMFGRPPRDTGMAAERNNVPTAAQRLHVLNSSHVLDKITKGPVIRQIGRTTLRDPRQGMDELFLAVLSRYPTDDELLILRDYAKAHPIRGGGTPLADMMWALINTPEFLYRH